MKRTAVVLALVAAGLLLAGCSSKVVQPPADQQELEFELWTPHGYSTGIDIFFAGGSETFLAERVIWYYDVPNDLLEYAIVSYNFAGNPSAKLHLLESKNPEFPR